MHPLVNIAIRAARRAGDVITRSLPRIGSLEVTPKGRHDYVSEVDRLAEQEIIAIIRKAYPDHGILAEESGLQRGGGEFLWVIDPLDGTTNFLHGFPQFAVSIAVKQRGRLEHGVVYDPLRQELYTTSRGGGSQLDGHRIRVAKQEGLEDALIGTGFPYREHQDLDAYLAMFKALFPITAGIRRAGAATLDLAYVAAGRMDGFWELGLSEWDMAAGALLVQEAGGLVGDLEGGDDYLKTGNIVAGNPKVFKALLQTIHLHRPRPQPR